MSLALLAAEPGTDAGRLADLLFAASPQRAAAFARARHEQLCQGCDEAETALWAKVAALLRGRF